MPATTDRNQELTRLTELAKGAVDTAVGLGVLGLHKLQVGRVELKKRLAKNEDLANRYSGLRSEAIRRACQVDSLVADALRSVESSFRPVTDRLPEPARHVATVAQARIDELHARISQFLAAAASEPSATETETTDTTGTTETERPNKGKGNSAS